MIIVCCSSGKVWKLGYMAEIASNIGSLVVESEGHFSKKCSSSPTSDWHSWHLLSDSGG